MEFIQTIDTAFATTAVIISVLAIACLVLLRKQKYMEQRFADMQAKLEQSQSDVSALCTGAVGVARRINRLESKLRIQNERQDKLELNEPNLQAYGQASRMAKKGADLEELVSTCGLSRGEAELIVMLNHNEVKH